MIRNIIAKIAKVTENKISNFKFNRKVCVILAAVITISSVSVSASKVGNTSNTALALSDSNISATTIASQASTEAKRKGLCKVTIVKHAGKPNVVYVKKVTVKNALKAAKVTVNRKDEINYKLSSKVFDGMSIVIDKVTYKSDVINKKITYKQFKKKYPKLSTSHLSKNEKVFVSETVEIKYVNGKKAETETKGITYQSHDVEKYTSFYGVESPGRKTINKNQVANTKNYSKMNTASELNPAKDFKLDKNGIPLNYSRKLTGVASAYSCGTHTATGKRVQPGYIAVNPRQIPYGTKMFIRSSDGNYIYGYASAEDTGGFVSWGNTIADLFFWSESTCRQFGRRSIEIYILD